MADPQYIRDNAHLFKNVNDSYDLVVQSFQPTWGMRLLKPNVSYTGIFVVYCKKTHKYASDWYREQQKDDRRYAIDGPREFDWGGSPRSLHPNRKFALMMTKDEAIKWITGFEERNNRFRYSYDDEGDKYYHLKEGGTYRVLCAHNDYDDCPPEPIDE